MMKRIMLSIISILMIFVSVGCTPKYDYGDNEIEETEIDNNEPNVVVWDVVLDELYDDIDNWFTTRQYYCSSILYAGVSPLEEYMFSLSYNREDFYNENNKYNFVVGSFKHGGVMVYKDGLVGIIDNNNNLVFKPTLDYETWWLMIYTNNDPQAKVKRFTLGSDYQVGLNLDEVHLGGTSSGISSVFYNRYDGLVCYSDDSSMSRYYNPYTNAVNRGLIDNGNYMLVNTYAGYYDFLKYYPEINIGEYSYIGYLFTNNSEVVYLNVPENYVVADYSNGVAMFRECVESPFLGYSETSEEENEEETEESKKEITFSGSTQDYYAYETVCGNHNYRQTYYYNENGQRIGSSYDDGYGFYEEYAAVCKDGKWGYIDKQGNVAVDFIFDKTTPISDGKAWVIYNGRTGKLNIIDMINNNVPFTHKILSENFYK